MENEPETKDGLAAPIKRFLEKLLPEGISINVTVNIYTGSHVVHAAEEKP